jgi:hypothetical protein
MAHEPEESGWVSIGKAARALGVSKSAIRKRIDEGTLAVRDDDGSAKVLLPFARPAGADGAKSAPPMAGPESAGADELAATAAVVGLNARDLARPDATVADADLAVRVAGLTERAAQLEARLAEAQAERDRWLAAAAEARGDARAAVAARDEAERELRLLLARAQFEPALPPGAPARRDATRPSTRRRRWRFWKR